MVHFYVRNYDRLSGLRELTQDTIPRCTIYLSGSDYIVNMEYDQYRRYISDSHHECGNGEWEYYRDQWELYLTFEGVPLVDVRKILRVIADDEYSKYFQNPTIYVKIDENEFTGWHRLSHWRTRSDSTKSITNTRRPETSKHSLKDERRSDTNKRSSRHEKNASSTTRADHKSKKRVQSTVKDVSTYDMYNEHRESRGQRNNVRGEVIMCANCKH